MARLITTQPRQYTESQLLFLLTLTSFCKPRNLPTRLTGMIGGMPYIPANCDSQWRWITFVLKLKVYRQQKPSDERRRMSSDGKLSN